MSDSVQPHRQQPTMLPCPWDSPGKNTGVGCHFLLQCMKVKSESEAVQLRPILSDPMDCSLPGSSINGIFQARVLEWVAIAFSMSNWVWPYGLHPARLLCLWDSPGKNTGVGCHALLQAILHIQGSNSCLLHLPVLVAGFFTTSTTWESQE